MTNKKFLWWAWVFWGGFGVVSFRAVFAKTARKGEFRMISAQEIRS